MDESKKKLEESLSVSIDNRKLEIELLWKRTTIFWGFIAALFIGVATVRESSNQLAFVLSTVGLVFSFIWTLSNRGSKSWQESWEIKAEYFFNELYNSNKTKNIYERVYDDEKDKQTCFMFKPRKYSLSRLLISLSDYTVIFWLGLCLYIFPGDFISKLPIINVKEDAHVIFFFISLLYSIYVIINTRSYSKGESIKERFGNDNGNDSKKNDSIPAK